LIFAISLPFLLIKPQRVLINKTLGDSFLTTYLNLNDFLESLNVKGKGIYLPPRPNEKNNFVFIPYDDRGLLSQLSVLEGIRDRRKLIKEGILLRSTGSSLINSIEREFGIDFSQLELNSLKETLSRLFINELAITNNFYLETLENKVYCIFHGSIFLNLCTKVYREIPEFCTKLGCPLNSAIASMLSKMTGRYVIIEDCIVASGKRKIETTYRLMMR
jgi:hypothetical protein